MEKGGLTTQCVRFRAKLAATARDNQSTGFTHCRRTTLMPFKEKLPGPMRLPIKRILASIVILILAFPCLLPAQEPRLHCRTVLADSQLPSAACDQNKNDSGVDNTAGTQNPPNQATNNSVSDWVHKWMRKADEARASQPHFVSP